jgi:hypothetical protein
MASMIDKDGTEIVGIGLHFEELPLGRKFRTIGRLAILPPLQSRNRPVAA